MLFDGNYTTFIEKRDQIKAIRLKELQTSATRDQTSTRSYQKIKTVQS